MKTSVKLSIRKKLFFFILIGFSLQIIFIVWQIRQQALKVSSETIQTSLDQSITVLNTKLDSRFYSIQEVARGISKDGRVLPLVFERESLTLQDLSLEFKEALAFDSLFFIADDGEILARSDRPEAIGRSIAGRAALFDDALANGESTQSFIVIRGKILQIVVEPILDNVANEIVRGLVVVAYELSSEIAADINKLTASDVGFFRFLRNKDREISGAESVYVTNNLIKSQIDEYLNQNETWSRFLEDTNSSELITTAKESYFSVRNVLTNYGGEPLGFILIFKSQSELMKPFNAIERSVIFIGMSFLLVSILIGIFVSIRLTKPILELVNMTSDIQAGIYPKRKARQDKPNDELDLLFNSVVQMGNSIKEKNDLEGYLAGIANELESDSELSDQSMPIPTETNKASSPGDLTEIVLPTTLNADSTLPGEGPASYTGKNKIGGRYQLLRNLGQGQFGVVFLAQDTQLNEKIALKIIDKNRLNSQDVILDFHEEIKLARRITHRNITRTYDFGEDGNLIFITMEYVDGFTLERLIREYGSINSHLGLIFAKQMCSAIHAAHEQGIIHRDLKPQNISITQQGVLKIMDFGLAVSIRTLDDDQKEKLQSVAAGTPKFMAPEQFYGRELDTRTDIYALGIIMYFLFTGKVPYSNNDFNKLAELHYKGKIPLLNEKIPHFPKELSDIVHKTMQKEPDERYQSVKEIYDSLNKVSVA